jgi:hypothetical protein
MRILIRLLAVALLGAAAAMLVSCGSSGTGLIPSADAGPLRSDFEAVAQAAASGNGDCATTELALGKTEEDFLALPATVDRGLHARLQQGIANLRKQARAMCLQPASTATSTSTQTTPTTTTTTTSTQTTPSTTPSNTTTTPPSTQTTPSTTTPSGQSGGTEASGEGSGEPGSGAGPGAGAGAGAGSGSGSGAGAGAGGVQENAGNGGSSSGGASAGGGQ